MLAVVWLSVTFSPTAHAQVVTGAEQSVTAIVIPENLTREQVRDLIARMSDDQVRELIITQLDKLVDTQVQPADASVYMDRLGKGIHVAGGAFQQMFASDDNLRVLLVSIWQGITEDGGISGWYLLFQ